MRQMAAYEKGAYLYRKGVTYNLWDADKVYGCLCDYGYKGYDCSEKICPVGDDPLTITDANNEVQTIKCLCPGTCSGTFTLTFRGYVTDPISYAAGPETIKQRLEALPTISNGGIDVSTLGSLVCSTTAVDIYIEFTMDSGDLSPITITSSIATIDDAIHGNTDLTASDSTIAADSLFYAALATGDAVIYTASVASVDATISVADLTTSGSTIAVSSALYAQLADGMAVTYTTGSSDRVMPLTSGTVYYVVKAPDSAATYLIVLFDTSTNALAATMTSDADVIASTGAQAVTSTGSGSATDHQLSNSAAPTLVMETIQEVKCTCTGTCSGFIYLRYDGETTAAIAQDAPAADVEAALESLTTISDVSVTFDVGSTMCGAAEVTTAITFSELSGNTPKLVVIDAITTSSTKSVAISTNDGDRIALECSGRGSCGMDGACTCFGLNTTSGWKNYSSSNGKFGGDVAAGTRGDCGYYDAVAVTPDDCPETEQTSTITGIVANVSCSGHGRCDTSTYTCVCSDGWSSGNCMKRTCPTGRAWFDEASADNVAHAEGALCSNKGFCNTATGKCTCQKGWAGSACEMLTCLGSASNAGVSNGMCSGNGLCKSMRQLAVVGTVNGDSTSVTYGATPNTVATWDADMIFACYCDKGFYLEPDRNSSIDFMCSRRPCPTGDNPLTHDTVNEVQMVTCTGTGGDFTLTYDSQISATIAFGASEADVKAALEGLSTIGTVTVDFGEGSSVACGASVPVPILVTFTTEFGDLPLMTVQAGALVGGSAAVTEYQSGRDGQYTEVQTVTCTCTGTPCTGSFALTFRSGTTAAILHDADTVEVMDALTALDSIGTVAVSFSAGTAACSTTGVEIYVDFTSDFGDLPIMTTSSVTVTSVTVAEKQAGSKENIECSGQGICDHATGRCKCFKGFSSSDGHNGEGTRGDCGRQNNAAEGECRMFNGQVVC
jgi:hypothetical protein